MGRKKEYLLVIDTETCCDVNQPLAYDIGYAVCDREGNIYLERSFVVAETFLDLKDDAMTTAYFSEKIPNYWDDIRNGNRNIKSIRYIRNQVREDMKKYNIHKVGAYNMSFDKKSLNNVLRYGTKSFFRWFFPYGTEFFCIWNMACQALLNSLTYIRFAEKYNLQTEKGNLLTSAEACYKYITKKIDFEEDHTGLEDVKIEIKIMAKCNATHKKIDRSINTQCWRLPQKKRKEILKKACN